MSSPTPSTLRVGRRYRANRLDGPYDAIIIGSGIGGLTAANPAGFHDPSGAGYIFLTDWLLRLDKANPQTAARMSTAFETWRRYDADRQSLIRDQLGRIAGTDGLSRDLSEMVDRMLTG